MAVPATTSDPSADLSDVLGAPKMKLPPTPMFFLEHRPLEMGAVVVRRVGDEDVWVPELNPVPVQPGAVGMRTVDSGETPDKAYTKALQVRRELDHIILPGTLIVPVEFLPPGASPGPAVRWQAVEAGRRYLLVWETVAKGLGNQARQELTHADLYAAWRVSLVASGALPEPNPEVIADAIRRQEARITRAERDTNLSSDIYSRNLRAAQSELARMKGARVPRRGQVVAAPTTQDILAQLMADIEAERAERRAEAEAQSEQLADMRRQLEARDAADAAREKAEASAKRKAGADAKKAAKDAAPAEAAAAGTTGGAS